MEALKAIHNPAGGLVVLAVNNGESVARVAKVAAERGYGFPVAVDTAGAAHKAYGIALRPTTVLIGPDGTVRAFRVGEHTPEAWRDQLRKHGLGR